MGLPLVVNVHDGESIRVTPGTAAAVLEALRSHAGEGSLFKKGRILVAASSQEELSDADGPFEFERKQVSREAVSIMFIRQKGGSKDRNVASEVFSEMPTWPQLNETVEKLFPEFAMEAFDLMVDDVRLHTRNWPLAAQHASTKKKRIEVAVVSTRRPFNSFKAKEGLELLGVTCVTSSTTLFAPQDLQLDDLLPEDLSKITTWKTVQDVVSHMGRDLAVRALLSDPRRHRLEARSREIISPALVAATILAGAGKIELHAEFNVEGVRVRGSPDWVMRYQELNIAVVEAKPEAKWEDYIGQLAAEMMGSREQFAMSILGKRKEETVGAMPEVPSWGILTNGLEYQFYRFTEECDSTPKELLASNPVFVKLQRGMTADQAMQEMLPVVAFVKEILQAQMACAEAIRSAKRLRVDTLSA